VKQKLVGMCVLIIAATSAFAGRPGFIPSGAYWRIDRHNDTPASSTGHWEEVGVYPGENGDWGQGRCAANGTECHLNDWVTWWELYGNPPGPTGGFTPVEWGSAGFPAGYNASLGIYYY